MENQICRNCAHFHQHYVVDQTRCTPISCGHCAYPRLKRAKPEAVGCKHFQEREDNSLPDRAEVVNFLTVNFLKHIMELQLPPEIVQEE